MYTRCLRSLDEIDAQSWNALIPDRHPFLRYEFLVALERHRCVGERTGWLPWHAVCFDDQHRLVGAAPLYLKDNSYGEFVFDWSWAEAYRRHGLDYYPKLVSAVPFTPATCPRLLIDPRIEHSQNIAQALIERALEETHSHSISSLHWLFPNPGDMTHLLRQGLMRRQGYQFHWHNPGYRDFADFLDSLTSKKRKNIKRERRLVEESRVEIQVLHGTDISEAQWRCFHDFYRSTFHRLGGIPTLTLPFFLEIGATLGDQIVLVMATAHGRHIGGAISFRSQTTLYGRHWGCNENYDSLHFEACYYQGIEYCIRHGLKCFEPGAQGEHKIYRGFLPTLTESAHWIAHPQFRAAIADFLERETTAIHRYVQELDTHSPYRESDQ